MRTAIVIPARYAARRLPGKPLLRSTGKYLIEHVYERARLSRRADDVLVATDDSRVAAAVESFGGRYVMTRRDHVSGSDRVAEVARDLDADCVINLQGDEPDLDPAALDMLPSLLDRDAGAGMATLAAPLTDRAAYDDPNCVKVVRGADGRALYFSRSPIPFVRDAKPDFVGRPNVFLQHVGVYAYRRDVLLQLAAANSEPLEELEKLEQLRALVRGVPIQVGIVSHAGRGVDTFEDYQRFITAYTRRTGLQVRAA